MLTVIMAFEAFRCNLELTGMQETLVATRQTRVRAAIEQGLAVNESFLTGSYRRHTLIAPMHTADIDIVVVLDRRYHRHGPRAVLGLVKDTLRETYQTSKISRNGQAVTITFADFTVDVVPAFSLPWPFNHGWDICDSGSNTWIRTNPKRHIEISSKVNKRTGGLLVPTVKMLKAWNRTVGYPLRNFHLEVLVWKILDPGGAAVWWGPGIGLGDDPDNVSRFFADAPTRLRRKLPDPARDTGDIGAYLSDQGRDEAISKLGTAAARCARAERLRMDGDESGANSIYRKVFGDAFPS